MFSISISAKRLYGHSSIHKSIMGHKTRFICSSTEPKKESKISLESALPYHELKNESMFTSVNILFPRLIKIFPRPLAKYYSYIIPTGTCVGGVAGIAVTAGDFWDQVYLALQYGHIDKSIFLAFSAIFVMMIYNASIGALIGLLSPLIIIYIILCWIVMAYNYNKKTMNISF